MIPIVISALLIGGILSYFYFVFAGKQHRKSTLLVDLGLSEKWSGEETTAFYKWAWTKASGERVWAERIVKNAFQKAEIWLSPDDLGYFESVCNDHAAGKPINQEKLKAKIQSIVKRSEVITHWVSDYVRDVLYQLTRISPDEAERSLRESGMRVESSKALVRYGTVNLRRKLGAVGAKILSVDSKGMKLEDPNSTNTFTLNGLKAGSCG